MSITYPTVGDRPGPSTFCPTELFDGQLKHGVGPTYIGIHYLVTNAWEAVCCARCQTFLRWATNAESSINAALRDLGQTPPDIP